MPKFNEQERDIIRERLFKEGQRLFSDHGIRKVTINDLTKAASISHGSFYNFFESKEHLFMEINLKKQREIFEQLDSFIYENKELEPRELTKLVMYFIMDKFFTDPIISSINGELWEYISRRLPSQTIQNNNLNDSLVVEKLTEAGVKFNVHKSLVVKVFQAVFMSGASFISDEEGEAAIDILMEGVIEKIVEE